MTDRERATGEIRRFLPLALLFFLWALGDDVAGALLRPSGGVAFLLLRAVELVVGSLVGAGILGSMGDCLAAGNSPTVEGFFRATRRYGGRFLGVYLALVLLALLLVAVIAVKTGLGPGGWPWRPRLLVAGACFLPLAGLRLLWASEIVAENAGFLRGLARGIGTAARRPRVLLTTAAFAAVSAADRFVAMGMPERPSLPIALARAIPGSAGLALALVTLGPRLIAAIREARGVVGAPGSALAGGELEAAPAGPRDRLARAALWLAIFSFVPLVHVAALLAGLRSLRRPGLFSVRGLLAAGLGTFFTAGYVLAAAGHFLPRTRVPEPALGFLAEADPSLADAMALLEMSLWQQAIDRVEAAGAPERSWAAHCLVGIARTRLGEHDAAEAAFARAFTGAGLSLPAELHYFHGRLQMERGSFPAAESSFTKALAILLLLTTHEVGHAWTAWKLGDDTAMSQGRISLNPLRHLDPVGSVLLPALLLWRNEEVNLVVCLAAFLLLLVACLGVRTAWPGVTTFHLAQPFGAMAVAGLPSPRAVGGVLLFLVLVMTPVFNIFVAIPAGLTWGLLHLSLAAMGFG